MTQKYSFSHRKIKELLEEYQKIYKASPKDKRKRLDYKVWSYLRDDAKYGVRAEFDDIWCIVYDIDRGKVICSFSSDHPFAELLKENTCFSSPKKKKEEKNMAVINSAVDSWKTYDTDNNLLNTCNCSNSTTANLTWSNTTSGWGADSINSICMNVDENNFHIGSKSIKEIVEEVIDKHDKNKKENETMKGFKFDFGPCTTDNVRMSTYGLAVKNANDEWVSYDSNSDQIINVDLLNFDGRKYMFKMPVAIKDIAVGDILIHNRVPMFVISVDDGIFVVDPRAGEEKKILPTHSPFGFDFVTKVVSMFTAFASTPTPEQPFGNFLPFMFANGDNDIDPMMLMFMMQNNGGNEMFSNPMMLYFLCGDKMKDNSMLPLMFLMNQNQPTKGKNGK